MNNISPDSLSIMQSSEDDTLSSVSEMDENEFQRMWGKESLAKPNLANPYETRSEQFNGESSSIEIKFDQPVIAPPPDQEIREYFHARQKWVGYVAEIGQETFLATLVPIVGEGSDLEAEIYLEDVEPSDRDLVEPGAVFYWSIGYLIKPSGNRCRASQIRFRRLPPWANDKLEAAHAKAQELMSFLDEE